MAKQLYPEFSGQKSQQPTGIPSLKMTWTNWRLTAQGYSQSSTVLSGGELRDLAAYCKFTPYVSTQRRHPGKYADWPSPSNISTAILSPSIHRFACLSSQPSSSNFARLNALYPKFVSSCLWSNFVSSGFHWELCQLLWIRCSGWSIRTVNRSGGVDDRLSGATCGQLNYAFWIQ